MEPWSCTSDPQDLLQLRAALVEAEAAIGICEPNPRVGCVIGHREGPVLGRGSTQAVGGPHAEIMALRDAHARGHSVRGATAWVTLEPCSHHGRTPPCCDALVDAGIARVVIGVRDPNPKVDGAGARRLAAAGIEVLWAPDELAQACRELNIGFFARHERGRPWVRMKAALSADGRVARPDGSSQWITGAAARQDGHHWRWRADAVVTGVGTVLQDDPLLTARVPQARRQPFRVVIDSQWRTPPTARLFQAPSPVWIVGCRPTTEPAARALADAGASLVQLDADTDGRVSLGACLQWLAERESNEVHLEAGPVLSGAMLAGGWVDEWLFYVAPRLLGEGLPPAAMVSRERLDEAPQWAWQSMTLLDGDLRLLARRRAAQTGGVDGPYKAAPDTEPAGAGDRTPPIKALPNQGLGTR